MLTVRPDSYAGRPKPLPRKILIPAILVNIPGLVFSALAPLIINEGNQDIESLNGQQEFLLHFMLLTIIFWPISLMMSLALAYTYRIYTHPLKKILIYMPLLPLVFFAAYYLLQAI